MVGILAEANAREMMSLRAWCLVIRLGPILHTKAWRPHVSTCDPRPQVCAAQRPRPSRKATATRTASSLVFHRYLRVGVKLFPVGCAQDIGKYSKTRKMLFLDLAPPALQNSGIFHDSTPPHLHFDGLAPKSRRSVVSI